MKTQLPKYYTQGNLLPVVEKILSKKASFLSLTDKHETPFYAYDQEELDLSIDRFFNAFQAQIPTFQAYFAVKLNHHPFVLRRVIEMGMGLDVASIHELKLALELNAQKIAYFSPGKSDDDIAYALENANTVRIHIDSFSELRRIGTISGKRGKTIEAGVRIHTPTYGSWSKYGIPLEKLKAFWEEAEKYPSIKLNGIHFHKSRNRTTDFYTETIKEFSKYISKHFSPTDLKKIQCVDFGGGFEPYYSEGVFHEEIFPENDRDKEPSHEYYILVPPTIEEYAQAIGDAIKKYLDPIISATYLSEPGRYICNSSMHIVLRIADVKDDKNCILDGGVNMVGWQRFEHEYFPLINLEHPGSEEKICHMWGNLCTPWDIWGYYCYADELKIRDTIVVPNQGALTYSLAQTFINDIPPVYQLPSVDSL